MKWRRAGPEVRFYALALYSLFLGQVLVSMQGHLHAIFSVILGNVGLLGCFALTYHGLALYLDSRPTRWHHLLLAAVIVGPLTFYTLFMPNVNARMIIYSLVTLAYCVAFLRLLLVKVRLQLGMNWILTFAAGCGIFVSLLWLINAIFLRPAGETIMEGRHLEVIIVLSTTPMSQRTEKARQESEALFQSTFDSAPYAILISDARGVYLEANNASRALYGYTRDQFLRMNAAEFWGFVNSRRIIDSRGRFSSIVSSITDFTGLRNAEEALRRSEEHYRNTFLNAPFGIIRSTMEGRLLAANPALARILGYASPEELLSALEGSTIGQVIFQDPDDRSQVLQSVLAGTGWQHQDEVRPRGRNGQTVIVNLVTRALNPSGSAATELETFECRSEPGQGTIFKVLLPRSREDAAAGEAAKGETGRRPSVSSPTPGRRPDFSSPTWSCPAWTGGG